ncbi:MAG: hypothetical protein AUJ85_05750 [Elusimicrobia bacterium CG1_02_37_114]|nr:MAG: hypothetical protein AUJ85_05750 [Elusimicrobia bacterium CG1_02_37_114]PIV52922.1 MAG: hypothetical protein COS17_06480 [Elusimicrobia bacterium CG02_land_8_20_14_3_00_37_13]
MKREVNLGNRKQGIYIGGIPHPRLYWKKGNGVKCQSVIIKCGDCNNKMEVSYGFSPEEKKAGKTIMNDPGIEINGVFAPTKFWKAFFRKIGL